MFVCGLVGFLPEREEEVRARALAKASHLPTDRRISWDCPAFTEVFPHLRTTHRGSLIRVEVPGESEVIG